MEKILEKITKKIKNKNLVLVQDCEEESWCGSAVIYFRNGLPTSAIKYCYFGDDVYIRFDDNREEVVDYGEIEIWKLPLDYSEVIDLVETVRAEVGKEMEKELQELIDVKITEIQNEIAGLQHEISNLQACKLTLS